MKKIILDLCGGTGAWSRPYQDAGYDVRLITLPSHDVTCTLIGKDDVTFYRDKHHVTGDYLIPLKSIHGILAAPPCTHFSLARSTAKTPRDFDGSMKIVGACLEIVWACRARGALQWWAMENPMGLLRQFMGVPAMTFQHWQYGSPFQKRTDIWGYFNPPRPAVKHRLHPGTEQLKSMWGNPRIPKELGHMKVREARAVVRAITPAGFARAFFKANP